MSISYKYIGKLEDVNNEQIYSTDNKGLITNYGEKGFKYIPNDDLDKEPIDATGIYNISDIGQLIHRPTTYNFTKDTSNNESIIMPTKAVYYFGIDNIQIAKVKYDKISAYISPTIEIGSSSYIQLSVKSNKDISNIEFSIIEKESEHPIVPIEVSKVSEKLFWNLDTRFTINRKETQLIRENNIETSLSLSDIAESNFNSNIYTIEYTPTQQSYLYYPETSSIKIKVIQRCLFDDSVPAVISNITILKYGGDKIWNM